MSISNKCFKHFTGSPRMKFCDWSYAETVGWQWLQIWRICCKHRTLYRNNVRFDIASISMNTLLAKHNVRSNWQHEHPHNRIAIWCHEFVFVEKTTTILVQTGLAMAIAEFWQFVAFLKHLKKEKDHLPLCGQNAKVYFKQECH